ncbi:molybdenum cofactor guanylyltransferase [Solicola sp. PLA-1-18]|uniref:molybdenum cofactor guanylyltransferase n=1 Tax=Solicola sp. PLA-1-18 TaxID=3380532 RepID=UPI003B794D22
MSEDGFDAVVLAGGAARRFGSDKTRVVVDGVTLLDRVLAACEGAGRVVVVGEERPLADDRDVTWVREHPPGSGPAQAVVAALPHLTARRVVLLAADLPHVTPATVQRLLDAAQHRPSSLVDAAGRVQHLCTVVETARLGEVASRRDSWAGGSMRSLLAPLRVVLVPAVGDEARDVDEPQDVPSQP